MPDSRRFKAMTASDTSTATAKVVSAAGDTVLVEVDAEVCPRCAAGQGCGAGLLAGDARRVSMQVTVDRDIQLAAGDDVMLTLEPGSLLRAALALYGLPLAGLLLGTAVGSMLAIADFAGAAAGLVVGLLAGRWIARRDPCLSTLRPTISGRASEADTGLAGEAR